MDSGNARPTLKYCGISFECSSWKSDYLGTFVHRYSQLAFKLYIRENFSSRYAQFAAASAPSQSLILKLLTLLTIRPMELSQLIHMRKIMILLCSGESLPRGSNVRCRFRNPDYHFILHDLRMSRTRSPQFTFPLHVRKLQVHN